MFITVPYKPTVYHDFQQVTLDDILNGEVSLERFQGGDEFHQSFGSETSTRTVRKPYVPLDIYRKYNFASLTKRLQDFCIKHDGLYKEERSSLYKTFTIPKKSGGRRTINAPQPALMNALRELKEILDSLGSLYHTSAFAYIKGRCHLDSLKVHQGNGSRWFLKLDFHDFFGSTTKQFVLNQLRQIFPFSTLMFNVDGKATLEKAIDLCFLNGGLPQGTPISPLLTNIMMIPLDYTISKKCRESDRHLVYTRYADDIIISSKWDFDWKDAQNMVLEVLKEFNAPFELNIKKTRYGSSSGRNWNLGLMINKDNNITIGHETKKNFKAMCFNYIRARKAGLGWDYGAIMHLNGIIAYYKMIEKSYIDFVIERMGKKTGVDIMRAIKEDTSPERW